MTEQATFKPSLTIGTDLLGGATQDLRLEIAADRTVRIAMPLGQDATSLMTVDLFKRLDKTRISLNPLSDPDEKGIRGEKGGNLLAGVLAPGPSVTPAK